MKMEKYLNYQHLNREPIQILRAVINRFEIAFWDGVTPLMQKSRWVRAAIRWSYAYFHTKDFMWIPALLLVWLIALVFTGVVLGNAIVH